MYNLFTIRIDGGRVYTNGHGLSYVHSAGTAAPESEYYLVYILVLSSIIFVIGNFTLGLLKNH